ncbi:hypothetical protein J2TS6_32190 [Paenibacillus albilobatus]|uniref:Uncharacterized protein n=1 Tax=Paenibacillus albilobatus TaxID=2716884 RepID=A0A919XIM2_9BACL|nr:hypothetical protein [Paenibacillus albilobatus]GIO32078.1 hypothetical protein J2TS6_32190 [Paenibacillus albilobatus]
MFPIYPLSEENILRHRGRMVLACTYDGRTYIGKLTHCRNGEIILNGDDHTALHAANPKPAAKRPVTSKKHKAAPKAQVRAFYPYGFGLGFGAGAAVALGLGTLAFLALI